MHISTHRLSDSGTAKETNLASLGIGSQQIHHLDAGNENLLSLALLREEGGGSANMYGEQ